MEEGSFDLKAEREKIVPPLLRAELARKMGVSNAYLMMVERGVSRLSAARRAQFREIASAWTASPSPRPRKPRKDIGKRHRKFKLKGSRKKRLLKQHHDETKTPAPV